MMAVETARRIWTHWKLPLLTLCAVSALFAGWRVWEAHLRDDALARAHLASVPATADFTFVSRDLGFLFTTVNIGFKASPEEVRRWWHDSPGTRDAQTSGLRRSGEQVFVIAQHAAGAIPPDKITTYDLGRTPHTGGTSITVAPDGTVDVVVFSAPEFK